MQHIDRTVILNNIKEMIGTLEFDAMRSPGKAKMNSQHLHSLYWLVNHYEAEVKNAAAAKPAKKEV